MAVYTSGDWHAKPGREEEFIAAWREMAGWSAEIYDHEGWGKLLRDKEDPAHFVSVAEWPSDQVVAEWRASAGLQKRLEEIRGLLESMHIRSFDLVAEMV